MGTPSTMSPEQVRGETADARSDLFSVGCVLYEMVTGQAPFTRGTPTETVAAVLKDEPPPIRVPVPPALVTTMRRCLEKEPARRFASAGELAAALRASEARPARCR
jgi:serine/threonine protein kinase